MLADEGGTAMSFDTMTDLNWLAVIVAALAYFAIGAVWYAPPAFGRAWMAAGGMTVEPGDGPGAAIFAVPLIGSVLSRSRSACWRRQAAPTR